VLGAFPVLAGATLTVARGEATVVAATSRVTTAPWGLDGGGEGTPGEVLREDTPVASMSRFDLGTGESVTIRTAGGGGYGTPTA